MALRTIEADEAVQHDQDCACPNSVAIETLARVVQVVLNKAEETAAQDQQ